MIPVHLSVGSNDTMVSIEETQNVQADIHNSRLHVIEDTPHPIEKVNPEKMATFILKTDS